MTVQSLGNCGPRGDADQGFTTLTDVSSGPFVLFGKYSDVRTSLANHIA